MISMTSWKKRLRWMLFLDELEPLVSQTLKVADFGSNSASVVLLQPTATTSAKSSVPKTTTWTICGSGCGTAGDANSWGSSGKDGLGIWDAVPVRTGA